MKDLRPIGIFDSGMGGLTVVKEVMRILPDEEIVYFGDTARVPYGPKSKETVIRFSIENILFLLEHGVKLIIIACNTSSSVALSIIKENFKVPILGVIESGVKEAIRSTKNNKIGIIGTRTTIKSAVYQQQIKLIAPQIKVYSICCPLFVPLVEEGWLKTPITKEIAGEYLKSLKVSRIDTLILGCTHYPLLKPVIREVLGDDMSLVDSARQVAQQTKVVLKNKNLLAPKRKRTQMSEKEKVRFYVSDEPENFAKLGRQFLGFSLKNVRKVSDV